MLSVHAEVSPGQSAALVPGCEPAHSGGVTLAEISPPFATTDVVLRPVPESRPPAQCFGAPGRTAPARTEATSAQPSLLDAFRDFPEDPKGPPSPRGVAIRRDLSPGSLRPVGHLPEPAGWAAMLGLAIGQAVLGVRPLSQLQTWLSVAVLADLRCRARQQARQNPKPAHGVAPPVRVVSVRIQCPTPRTVEATVHLRIGPGSLALGVRLQAVGQRWLCTALARPQPRFLSALPAFRDTA